MKRMKAPPSWAGEPIQIALIGCGGTGSAMLDELYRMHALLVRLEHPGLVVCAWDGDEVKEANIGRQRFWPCDIGWRKAEILVNRYNSFGDADWSFEGRMLERKDCERLRADVIVSCVDSAAARVMIGEVGRERDEAEVIWIDAGNGRDSGQVVMGHWRGRGVEQSAREKAVPNVLDLYPSLREQEEDKEESCSTEAAIGKQDFGINQRMAAEASGLLWQLIRYGETDRHGSFVYMKSGEVMPLMIDESQWAAFAA